jgi:hypothetical protein
MSNNKTGPKALLHPEDSIVALINPQPDKVWWRFADCIRKPIATISTLLIAFMSVCGLLDAHAQAKRDSPGADLIVHNAKILTGNPAQPEASALAVKDGRIYSVGTDAEVTGLKNTSTRLIDAGGRRLIPGMIDAHTHVLNESGYNYNVRWDGVPTLRRALAMLSEQAKRTPRGTG